MIPQDPAEFLFHEAHLLDRGYLDEWLALFADDAIYWLPQRDDDNPAQHVSLIYDNRTSLRGRVVRLKSGFAHSQLPPSRTTHFVGNVRVVRDDADEVEVHSTLMVLEARRREQSVYAGAMEHLLARTGEGLRVRRKVVRLVNGDIPLGNLTFLI
jgi:3-phenylpropionate/cinnamic acid dioxygenase small subunit